MKNLIVWALVVAVLGYFDSKFLLHHKVEKGVDGVVLAISPFVDIEYEGVSSTMSGELTTDGIRARVNSDYMKRIHRERIKALSVTDADSPAAQCAGKYGYSPAALSSLGYSEQVVSVSAHFHRGAGKYSISVRSNIKDMWDVDAELTLSGDMIAEMARGIRYRQRMDSMRIEYKDQSLNDRVRKYCDRLGLDDTEILQAQLDALRYFGEENGIEFDEYVVEPYTEFLMGKSTLVVTANPSEPISLSQISLYKPSDVPALLDLSAEAY